MFAFFSWRPLLRGTINAGLKVHITESAVSAGGQHNLLTVARHVEELFARFCVKNDGPDRYAQRDVISRGAVLVRSATVLAVTTDMFACVAEINQCIDVSVGCRKNATAFATIAAIWPTLRDEFLSAKAMRAITAFPSNDFNSGFVDEFHRLLPLKKSPAARDRAFWTDSRITLPR